MTLTAPMVWLRAERRRFDLAVAIATVGLSSLLFWAGPDEFDTGWPDVAAGVGAFVLLLFRRQHTLTLLAVALTWTAVHVTVLERPTVLVFALLVLLATAAVRLDRWRAIGLGGAVAFCLYLITLSRSDSALGDPQAVIFIAWTAAAVGVGDATRSWRQFRQSSDAEIRSAVMAAEAQTSQRVLEERLAIARELHDFLAHNLSVMNVQTGAALHLLRSDPDRAEESLLAARNAGRSILDESRDLLAVLRREDTDQAPTSSLPTIEELPTLVDNMRSAGLTVSWTLTGEPQPVTPAVSLATYRITQEALTNAAKHGTGSAELLTEWDRAGLKISVSNQADPQTGIGDGHGLVGMRERAVANGGRLSAQHVDGHFLVESWLPGAADAENSTA